MTIMVVKQSESTVTGASANKIFKFLKVTCDAGVAALGFPAVFSGDVAGSCLTAFGSDFPRTAAGFPESAGVPAFWWDSSDGGATNSWTGVVSLLFVTPDVVVSVAETWVTRRYWNKNVQLLQMVGHGLV